MKTRYRGEFNWHGEIHILYTYATSKPQARRFLLTQLAKKIKRTYGHLSNYFGDDEKDNVYITIDRPLKKNAYSTIKSLPSLKNIKQELTYLKLRGYDKNQLKVYLKKVYGLNQDTQKRLLKNNPPENTHYIFHVVRILLDKKWTYSEIVHFISVKFKLSHKDATFYVNNVIR